MEKDYRPFVMLDGSKPDFGFISKSKHNAAPWQGTWTATGAWITVPNVRLVTREKDIDGKGVETATVVIENVVFKQMAGVAGIFHMIHRGYLAPWTGLQAAGRAFSGAYSNEWYDVLNGGYRIRIYEGYGDQLVPVFTGLIDDTDVHSAPDVITLTTRSFGLLLTDQRCFGWNKAAEIPSPIVFCDRNQAEVIKKESAKASASTSRTGHPPSAVTKADNTSWISGGAVSANFTQWVQIHVPKGRYSQFFLRPHYAGMEAYLSIYARNDGLGAGGKIYVDGEEAPEGWVNMGLGNVPGANGGHPFVKHYPAIGDLGMARKMPITIDCGNDTVIRISFRNLAYRPELGDYRAGAERLIGYKQDKDAVHRNKHWIVVDDAADVVRWVLMWAGFKEWYIEDFGVRLKEPMVFHQGDFLIDIINHMLEQADLVFYVAGPTGHADSIGVPVFKRKGAFSGPTAVREEVKHSDLLTQLETKFSKEPLSYIIRVRGKPDKKGSALGEDSIKRIMAVYRPPWSGESGRMNRLIKHVIHTDNNLETQGEVEIAAILIAFSQALASYQGTCEMPGYPWEPDQQVSIVDVPSGTNSRMWIKNFSSTITLGTDAEYKITLSGSLLDTPDTNILARDFATALRTILSESE